MTATITYANDDVRTLTLSSGETLFVTGNHRMFSATAQDWVPVKDLSIGEELHTTRGRESVAALGCQHGRHQVYNLEVEAEHCYFVGIGEVLTHNAASCTSGENSAAAEGRRAHKNYGTALDDDYDTTAVMDSGKKPDAVNWDKNEVRELKPDNERAVKRGEKQVEAYRQELEKMTGEKWTAKVDTYQPASNRAANKAGASSASPATKQRRKRK